MQRILLSSTPLLPIEHEHITEWNRRTGDNIPAWSACTTRFAQRSTTNALEMYLKCVQVKDLSQGSSFRSLTKYNLSKNSRENWTITAPKTIAFQSSQSQPARYRSYSVTVVTDKSANTADVPLATCHSVLLAIVRYYFPDAWHAVSLVRDKKKSRNNAFLTFVQIHDPRSELPDKQNPKSGPKKLIEPRTAAISGSENPLKFRSESEIRAK